MKTRNTLELCLGEKIMSVLLKSTYAKAVTFSKFKRTLQQLLKRTCRHKKWFSKFCKLRPKWCVLLVASGTHCVCVCTYHQNMKLILDTLNLEYKRPLKIPCMRS